MLSLLHAGKQRVYDNGRLHWPNGRYGMCGDAFDAPVRKNERPGRITGRVPVGYWGDGCLRTRACSDT